MDPGVVAVFIPVVAIIAVASVKIARLLAVRPQLPSADVTERLEDLEHSVQSLQQQLAEAQERLDFAERVLAKARDERRIGS